MAKIASPAPSAMRMASASTPSAKSTLAYGPPTPVITSSTPDAARQQWQLNSGLEKGEKRDITVGQAAGLLYVRRDELLLSVVDGPRTLAVQVPDRTVPKGRARENLVTDFAQRALKIDPNAPPPAAPALTQPPVQISTGG